MELDGEALVRAWRGLEEMEAHEIASVLVGPEDPLGLESRILRHLDVQGYLLEPDRVLETAAAWIASDRASGVQADPGELVAACIEGACQRVIEELGVERAAGVPLPEPRPLSFLSLQGYFGVADEHLLLVLVEFHRLPREQRHALLHVVLMRKGYDRYRDEAGVAPEVARSRLAEGIRNLARATTPVDPHSPPRGGTS